jgi:SAM-dependent methyltransferase
MGTAQIQGELWGAKAAQWVEFQEPVQRPMYDEVLARLGVGRGTKLLDVGCGSGGALVAAHERGAEVAGLDASEALVALARKRLPDARIEIGEMEELPFADVAFDAVTGFNSFQFAGDAARALREAARVCRPGGAVAVLIWGPVEESDIPRAIVPKLGPLMPSGPAKGPSPFDWTEPERMEGLMQQAGLNPAERGEVACAFAYADVATAWRANSAAAPFVRAARHSGDERLRAAFVDAVKGFVQKDGAVVLSNKFRWIIGRRA